MANVIHTDATVGDILKRFYVEGMQEAIRKDIPFYQVAEKTSMPTGGEAMYIDVHLALNPSTAARDPEDYVPDAGVFIAKQGSLSPTIIETPFVISNTLIAKSRNDKMAFVRGLDQVMEDARLAIKRDLNRQWCGDQTGVRATVAATVTASATVTVDTTRFLQEGLIVDFWNSNTLEVSSATISTIDSDTQVTMSATMTATNADVIIRAGNAYLLSGVRTSRESNGLSNITGTGSFMGISGTTYRAWRSPTRAVNGPINTGELVKLLVQMRQNGPGMPDTVFTHPAQSWGLQYGAAGIYADMRWNPGNQMDLGKDGLRGTQSFTLDGRLVRLQDDVDFAKDKLFLFEGKKLLIAELTGLDIETLSDKGEKLIAYQDSGGLKLALRGVMTWRGNMGCRVRVAFGSLTSLTVPTGF